MKKQDIKSDPIKDKIVEIVDFIVSNSKIVWFTLFSFVIIIILFSYYSSEKKYHLINFTYDFSDWYLYNVVKKLS